MSIAKFINSIDGEEYKINESLIPQDTLLDMIYRRRPDKTTNTIYTPDPSIGYVIEFIINPSYDLTKEQSKTLDYWGIQTYESTLADEDDIRREIQDDSFLITTLDPDHHRLNNMSNFSETYKAPETKDSVKMFTYPIESIPAYSDAQKRLGKLNWLFDLSKQAHVEIGIVGECVFNSLMGTEEISLERVPKAIIYGAVISWTKEIKARLGLQPDINVFFVRSDIQNISTYLDMVASEMLNMLNETIRINEGLSDPSIMCERTSTFISITSLVLYGYQTIVISRVRFRLGVYKSYSEILYEPEDGPMNWAECERLYWDGMDIWATPRCEYALRRGYNTVISRYSPYVVSKYAIKGIAVLGIDDTLFAYRVNNLHILFYESMESYTEEVVSKNVDLAYTSNKELYNYVEDLLEYVYGDGVFQSDEETLELIEEVASLGQIEALSESTLMCNYPFYEEIVIIEDTFNVDKGVVGTLMIPELIYKLMEVWTGVELTMDVDVISS